MESSLREASNVLSGEPSQVLSEETGQISDETREVENPSMAKKRSKKHTIWQYFEKCADNKLMTMCTVCGKKYQHSNNTSNLAKVLKVVANKDLGRQRKWILTHQHCTMCLPHAKSRFSTNHVHRSNQQIQKSSLNGCG